MTKLTRLLTSPKLAAVLLTTLTAVSIAAVTLQSSGSFWGRYALGRVLLSPYVRIHDGFHSWWFIALLLLLTVNLACCTWKRAWALWNSGQYAGTPRFGQPDTLTADMSCHDTLKILQTTLKNAGYRTAASGDTHLAGKHRYSKWGSIVFHVSMIVLVAGAAVNQLWGFKGQVLLQQHVPIELAGDLMFLKKGYLANPPLTGVSARLDDFKIHLAAPMKYAQLSSTVVFSQPSAETPQKIDINRPGTFAGLSWRFKEFGYSPLLNITSPEGELINTYLNLGTLDTGDGQKFNDLFRLDTRTTAYVEFMPDAIAVSSGSRGTRSYSPDNPLIHLTITRHGRNTLDQYIPLHQKTGQNGFSAAFAGYRHWVLMDITANPGEKLMFPGFALGLAGLIYRLLFPEKKIWFKITPASEASSLVTYQCKADSFNRLFKEEVRELFTNKGVKAQ